MKTNESRRYLIGAAGSVIWVIVAMWWTFRCGVPAMQPNEWGDWAAGVFAPLAFLWLVLGYMQQGAEIRENTKELADSVKAQNRAALAASAQAASSRLIASSNAFATVMTFQPLISVLRSELRPEGVSVTLSNDGRWCYNFVPTARDDHELELDWEIQPSILPAWGPGLEQTFYFRCPTDRDFSFQPRFYYLDALGQSQIADFLCQVGRPQAGLLTIAFFPLPFVPKLNGADMTMGGTFPPDD
jgi:hypothetical protein